MNRVRFTLLSLCACLMLSAAEPSIYHPHVREISQRLKTDGFSKTLEWMRSQESIAIDCMARVLANVVIHGDMHAFYALDKGGASEGVRPEFSLEDRLVIENWLAMLPGDHRLNLTHWARQEIESGRPAAELMVWLSRCQLNPEQAGANAQLIGFLYDRENFATADRLLQQHFPQYAPMMMRLPPEARGTVGFGFQGRSFFGMLAELLAPQAEACDNWFINLPTLQERVWAASTWFQSIGYIHGVAPSFKCARGLPTPLKQIAVKSLYAYGGDEEKAELLALLTDCEALAWVNTRLPEDVLAKSLREVDCNIPAAAQAAAIGALMNRDHPDARDLFVRHRSAIIAEPRAFWMQLTGWCCLNPDAVWESALLLPAECVAPYILANIDRQLQRLHQQPQPWWQARLAELPEDSPHRALIQAHLARYAPDPEADSISEALRKIDPLNPSWETALALAAGARSERAFKRALQVLAIFPSSQLPRLEQWFATLPAPRQDRARRQLIAYSIEYIGHDFANSAFRPAMWLPPWQRLAIASRIQDQAERDDEMDWLVHNWAENVVSFPGLRDWIDAAELSIVRRAQLHRIADSAQAPW
jgi:hypothetical protein